MCGFNLQLIQLAGSLGVSFLGHTALGFNGGFISLCTWVVHGGLLLRLPWRTWVCPCEGRVWRWRSCSGHRGSGSSRLSAGLVARAAGNDDQYWPKRSSTLAWRTRLTEKPGRPQSTGRKELDTTKATLRAQTQDVFCLWQLGPSKS